jgi:hypothetical protein
MAKAAFIHTVALLAHPQRDVPARQEHAGLRGTTRQRLCNLDGSPYSIDVSGFGLRFAVQISLFGKPAQ